jgi:hypothetical protein
MAGSLTIDNINGKVISSSPVATESQIIGVGQTWQDVTASRNLNVTYTNSTNKPIIIKPTYSNIGGNFMSVTLNGTLTFYIGNFGPAPGYYTNGNVVIPAGNTYSVSVGDSPTKMHWLELR